MNAVIKRISFAEGNYVTADVFATHKEIPAFVATSRFIDKLKAGLNKIDTVKITAVERPTPKTRAKSSPVREIHMCVPGDFETGVHSLKTRADVSFSFKDEDGTIYEGDSGEIKLEPASGENVKGSFNVNLELPNTNGKTFIIKGDFQVRKAG
jgi:hypothetical protein